MSDNKPYFDLARFFDKVREIIEAAETPFAKMVIFVLPILAPFVPAMLTGLHLYKLFLEIFEFSYASEMSATLSVTVALVLEMLGYVGAISFIHSIFDLVRYKEDAYLVPVVLNGMAYVFYLVAMYLINRQLGIYFGVEAIINNIVTLLSLVTVPTGLLAANHLNQVEYSREREKRRQEDRSDRLERLRIRQGKVSETSQKVSTANGNFPESFEKVSDWRKVRPKLSRQDLRRLANLSTQEMQTMAAETGLTLRTISNWRNNAKKEMQDEE